MILLTIFAAILVGCGVRSNSQVASKPGRAAADSSPAEGRSMAIGEMAVRPHEGVGPGQAGDRYDRIVENAFLAVASQPLSTFSIDVDTASYAKTRMYLMKNHLLPPPDAVRIEELVNYFVYDYQGPRGEAPFSTEVEVARCPWKPNHLLAKIGVQAARLDIDARPPSNLVFLLDVSGSMNHPDKLPLLKRGMKMLVDQLNENDRVAIVVYAGAAGLVLDATSGDQKQTILDAFSALKAGGSTNGGKGVQLAYRVALEHFIPGGVNRVLLCTDGDFNVGVTSPGELIRFAEKQARGGVRLSVLGFGMGNHNDSLLEQLSNKADGNYAFIDDDQEARKVLVEQLSGTLVTVAKDVKIQVEFNPAQVAAYRLIGYENRLLHAEDFNDDQKDAGEIGAGLSVTALYEIVPVGAKTDVKAGHVDPLKYQSRPAPSDTAQSSELFTVKLRYKQPQSDASQLISLPVENHTTPFAAASPDFKFAAAVAAFGMLLRESAYCGQATWESVLQLAREGSQQKSDAYRAEFIEMVGQAKTLASVAGVSR